MSDAIIETKNLWKIYGGSIQEVNAIQDISVKIPSGKISCITGPSGSGKSTFLALIGLLTSPSQGQVIFKNEIMNGLSEITLARIRRENFGFIFQSQYLLPNLSALENARLPLLSCDLSIKEINLKTSTILHQLDLDNRIEFLVKELSGGEAQRVAIARALVSNPSILIADEPSSSIDSKLTEEFLNIVSNLKKQEFTVIMASHDPQVIKIADTIIKLKDGSVT